MSIKRNNNHYGFFSFSLSFQNQFLPLLKRNINVASMKLANCNCKIFVTRHKSEFAVIVAIEYVHDERALIKLMNSMKQSLEAPVCAYVFVLYLYSLDGKANRWRRRLIPKGPARYNPLLLLLQRYLFIGCV